MSSGDVNPVKIDKYRSFLHEDAKNDNIVWRHGAPPEYDAVNKLFEEGRKKVSYYIFLCFGFDICCPKD